MRSRFDFFDSDGKEYSFITEGAVKYREIHGLFNVRGEKLDYVIGIELLLNGEQGKGIREIGEGMQILFREEKPSIYPATINFDKPIRIGIPSGKVLGVRK